MNAPSVSAFKKAMQVLTTTVVKAEAAERSTPEFMELHEQGLKQLEELLAIHAALEPTEEGGRPPHQTWFEQTVARARAVFGIAA